MESDVFEWDDAKAASNYRKHGVHFLAAKAAFADAFGVEEFVGVEGGEERLKLIGFAGSALVVVIFTERGVRIRIISARYATRKEHDRYYRENAQD